MALVDDFQFNDSVGTGLLGVANAGSSGASWNFNLSSPAQGATDGAGTFFVGQNATAGSATIATDFTRILDTTDVSTGNFRFEASISFWDLDDTPDLNGTFGQEGLTFRIRNGAGDDLNLVSALTGNDLNFRYRHATSGGITGSPSQNTPGLTGAGYLVWAEGNLDTGFFTSGINDGMGDTVLISDGAGLTDIAEIRLQIEGDNGGWATTDSIGLGFVTRDVTAVPEPSSFALVGLALGILGRRRRLS